MRIVHASDFHLDATTGGYARLTDVAEAVQTTMVYAVDTKADAYLFTGDLMDPDSGACVFGCIRVITTLIRAHLITNGIPSYWIPGNHDVMESGTNETTLSPLKAMSPNLVTVIDEPLTYRIGETRGGMSINLLALPFTSYARAYDPSAWVKKVVERSKGQFILGAGHMTDIPGIKPGEETTDMARGRNVTFPIDDFPKDSLMVNGHWHHPQTFEGVHIPGSVARLTFGEELAKPRFLELEI